MIVLKKIALIFFDLIDKYYHQKRINNFLKEIKINFFLDVGAYLGTYTDLIFEPQSDIYRILKSRYRKKKNITVFNCAISNKTGVRKLYVNKHRLTSTFLKFNLQNSYLNYKAKLFGSTLQEMTKNIKIVKTKTLKKIIKGKKIKNIDLVKIDTQGHEFEVLKGIGSKIRIIKCFLLEFHQDSIYHSYDPKKIHKYLIKNHFFLKKIYSFPFTTWEDRFYINKQIK